MQEQTKAQMNQWKKVKKEGTKQNKLILIEYFYILLGIKEEPMEQTKRKEEPREQTQT